MKTQEIALVGWFGFDYHAGMARYDMQTFEQYLEGMRLGGKITFNTRKPDYDIGVTGDYSEDHDDARHFLLPFARKIKSFHWYCKLAAEEIANNPYPLSLSRNQDSRPIAGRVAALRSLTGRKEELPPWVRGISGTSWYGLSSLAGLFKEIHDHISNTLSTHNRFFEVIMGRVEEAISQTKKLLEVDYGTRELRELTDKIKVNLRRMLNFLEKSLPQIRRLKNVGVSVNDKRPSVYGYT